jgi:SIR2-like domain
MWHRSHSWRHPNEGEIARRLYPESDATALRREQLKHQAKATSAALRLADEFSAAFGRPALDDLILEAIPDADFAPGPLHRLLMELPWADVLTTNYETLLERAAASALGQRYSVVRTVQEISAAVRPRIVKLHGSFPSSRPFILTEEDFRTYPQKFAPFVNLAQQTVMENTLCLIGFSGNDPDFLYWTGWVRDQGQLLLKRCSRKDFEEEVFVPSTNAAFHDDTVVAGMLL